MNQHILPLMLLGEALTGTLPEFAGVVAVNVPNDDDRAVRAVAAHVRLTGSLVALVARWVSDGAAFDGVLAGPADDDEDLQETLNHIDSIRADIAVICDKLQEFGSGLPPKLADDWVAISRQINVLRNSLDDLSDGPNG